MVSVPYENATSGERARNEITKILRELGCSRVGFMDDMEKHSIILAFSHRGREMRLEASAEGWASMYLRMNPHSSRMKRSLTQHKQFALRQGMVAINSVLRDWVKGQVTAIECGILSFEDVFMPVMLTDDGRTIGQIVRDAKMLPAPSA